MWYGCNSQVVWMFFCIAFLWDWNENWPFPVLWPLLSFPNPWHIECSTFTASSFRTWNSSAETTSPPSVLFIVILHKAHLISHSKMSGSRWVITALWLSGLLRSILYSFSVYCCYLSLISSASKSISFLSFIMPIFAWTVLLVSLIFFMRSLVFPILLFSSISSHWSWRKTYLSLLAILQNAAFKWVYLSFSPLSFTSLLFSAICKASSDNHFAFLLFFSWGWSWSLPPVQCHKTLSIVLQTLGLSDLIPWMYLSLPLYNCKGLI